MDMGTLWHAATNQPVLMCLCEYVHLFVSHWASVYSPESNLWAKTESHNLELLPAKLIMVKNIYVCLCASVHFKVPLVLAQVG